MWGFRMYDLDGNDVASTIYYGLFALQHRGQESCGIAVSDTCGPKGKVTVHKDMGLVNEVFAQDILDSMKGGYRRRTCPLFHGGSIHEGKRAALGAQLCEGDLRTCP